jgi:hypothetical protein
MRAVPGFIRRLTAFAFAALLTLTILTGCRREEAPLPPLPADQIAAEFGKAFGNARQSVKVLSDRVLKGLADKDYPAAFAAVQELSIQLVDAPRAQQTLAARAMVTINGLLQTAQSQGDEKATAALKQYQGSK